MGAQWAPQQILNFVLKKLWKKPDGLKIFLFSGKLMEMDTQIEKSNGRTMGAAPMIFQKTSWASQNEKNDGQRPFFQKSIFSRPWSWYP